MTILYLSFTNLDHSSNPVYIKGLRKNGAEVLAFHGSLVGIIRFYFANRQRADYIFVGVDNPTLVPWLKLVSRKKIVYYALCSVIERLIISRGLASKHSLKYWLYWMQDFLAGILSHKVMLETDHQIEFFEKTFGFSRKKLVLARTGVDDDKFFYDPALKKFDQFTVIFRGRLLPEAGAEYAVRAAKLLENQNIKFIMHAFGQELPKIRKLIAELKPANLELITEFLPIEKVREQMQKSHLSLGQLSNHERLQRTIPHKAYESLALQLPYLTARNPAVMELLKEGETCLACNPADARDLAAKILWAKDHPEELEKIAQHGHELYKKELTPEILAKHLLTSIGFTGNMKR